MWEGEDELAMQSRGHDGVDIDDSRFWAPPKRALSSLRVKSTSMRLAPARSCMIIPEVTMGEIPSSMRVPLFEARITRIQKSGSEESDETIPYSGICEETKKMSRTMAVHAIRCWKGTGAEKACESAGQSSAGQSLNLTFVHPNSPLRSGVATSGRTDIKGRTRFKNRNPPPLMVTKWEGCYGG